MLIDYRFSNFRSFKNMTSLSMRAGRQTTLNDNLIRKNNFRILPSAVIYGANASGKSNIIMSLEVMKDIVLAGSLEVKSPNLDSIEYYQFAYGENEKPISFEIEFLNDGKHVEFAFSFMATDVDKKERYIVSESLSFYDGKGNKNNIYIRKEDQIEIDKSPRTLSMINFEENLLIEFENKINKNIDSTELFLTRALKNTISNEIADIVLDFFEERLLVVSDFTLRKSNLLFTREDSSDKDIYIWNKLIDAFVKNADFGPQKISFRASKNKNKTQEPSALELVSKYKISGKDRIISAELMESRGTLKLIDFALPFEHLFTLGGVFVLDEFDATIHPELIKGIIALFNDSEINKAGAQLIFTTHNPVYMDNKMFRRDQIRFVEKDTDTFDSIIYSLSDFGSVEVRNDHNYLINYFKGNYGALPFVDFTKLLKDRGEGEGSNENV